MDKKCHEELEEELGGLTPCVYNVFQFLYRDRIRECKPGEAFRCLDQPEDEEMCRFLLKKLKEADNEV